MPQNPNDLKKGDIVIPILGLTGSGKSTFINAAAKGNVATVGHHINSCTKDVQYFIVPKLSNSTRRVILVDTPGFDDTYLDDPEILRRIVDWLGRLKHGVNIAGIVHLHDISVRDTTGKGIDFLRLNDSTNKVIPAITKWSDVDDQELAQRKQQLSEAYHIESNDIARFDRTAGSAWHIINLILDKDPSNGLPLLQELLKLRDSYPAIPKKIPTKKGFFAWLFKRQ